MSNQLERSTFQLRNIMRNQNLSGTWIFTCTELHTVKVKLFCAYEIKWSRYVSLVIIEDNKEIMANDNPRFISDTN